MEAHQYETLNHLLTTYGSLALFFLLALGIFALPIPDETLIVLAGVLLAEERLSLFATSVAGYAGSMCGITLSYFLGAVAGKYLIRHGGWLGFTDERQKTVHRWYRRYGKWVLVFGYFVPGVRHVTGLVAGMGMLEYRQFACFAYSGAVLWVSTFLLLGYFVGDYALKYLW